MRSVLEYEKMTDDGYHHLVVKVYFSSGTHWHRCGYVGVPKNHPFYGKYYDGEELEDCEVHGGLTYGSQHSLGNPYLWYFGFDCAHAGDNDYGGQTLAFVLSNIDQLDDFLKNKVHDEN